MLKRPRNAGRSTYGGEVVGTSAWPLLLTEDTWRSVCAVLGDPARRRSSSNRLRWLTGRACRMRSLRGHRANGYGCEYSGG